MLIHQDVGSPPKKPFLFKNFTDKTFNKIPQWHTHLMAFVKAGNASSGDSKKTEVEKYPSTIQTLSYTDKSMHRMVPSVVRVDKSW